MDSTPQTYSLTQAATILRIHRNTLAGWIDGGCPVVKRADRDRGIEWEIAIADVLEWRVGRKVEEALASYQGESGQVTREEADRRRAVAMAIVAEIGADEALGNVVTRDDAEADMAAFCVGLKTAIANACAKIAARAAAMRSAPDIQELCHKELNRAFDAAQAELAKRWAEPAHADPEDAAA